MTKKDMRFEIGDWIVHYYYGIGKVKDIVEKGLEDNKNTFYKVSTKEIDYWIPIDREEADHIEPIRSKEDFENAYKILSSAPEPIGQHYKTRKNRIHDRWLEGSLNSRAKLIRDLNGRLNLEKISFNEKEMFEKVKRFYIAEWIMTDKALTRKDARKRLKTALKESVTKAKKAQKEAE